MLPWDPTVDPWIPRRAHPWKPPSPCSGRISPSPRAWSRFIAFRRVGPLSTAPRCPSPTSTCRHCSSNRTVAAGAWIQPPTTSASGTFGGPWPRESPRARFCTVQTWTRTRSPAKAKGGGSSMRGAAGTSTHSLSSRAPCSRRLCARAFPASPRRGPTLACSTAASPGMSRTSGSIPLTNSTREPRSGGMECPRNRLTTSRGKAATSCPASSTGHLTSSARSSPWFRPLSSPRPECTCTRASRRRATSLSHSRARSTRA
mmetsp:Transcript_11315/g.33566  ORF Transcript_11315/g.33566 Transcript_11315/m.33566 type:complete len:259 (+) Transcript_11315:789-1565(+)